MSSMGRAPTRINHPWKSTFTKMTFDFFHQKLCIYPLDCRKNPTGPNLAAWVPW